MTKQTVQISKMCNDKWNAIYDTVINQFAIFLCISGKDRNEKHPTASYRNNRHKNRWEFGKQFKSHLRGNQSRNGCDYWKTDTMPRSWMNMKLHWAPQIQRSKLQLLIANASAWPRGIDASSALMIINERKYRWPVDFYHNGRIMWRFAFALMLVGIIRTDNRVTDNFRCYGAHVPSLWWSCIKI